MPVLIKTVRPSGAPVYLEEGVRDQRRRWWWTGRPGDATAFVDADAARAWVASNGLVSDVFPVDQVSYVDQAATMLAHAAAEGQS